jgi:hypothetical protein
MSDPIADAQNFHTRLVWLFCLPGIVFVGWFLMAGDDGRA